MPIVRVALDVPLHTLLDYAVAKDVDVGIGQRVVAPFGRRRLVGIVMEGAAASEISQDRIKPLDRVLTDSPPLSAQLLDLLRFCSNYYRFPIGQTVMSALPARLRSYEPLTQTPTPSYRLSAKGTALDLTLLPKRKVVQRRILAKLAEQPCGLGQLRELSSTAASQLKMLVEQGLVESFSEELAQKQPVSGSSLTKRHRLDNAHILTAGQQMAVNAISQADAYVCFLLYGITGSGKTEVYVHLMHQVLERGRQVLMLVPEINLTPQLESYFRNRFPEVNLISLHSGLSEAARLRNWRIAQCGSAGIVLGTRLAVFAELPKLSLIIVDEEHDSSFKQQDGLRYSARDVAIFRAKRQAIPVVLGSATPSLESYHNARSGRYQMLKLSGRALAQARLPNVGCINTNQTVMHQGVSDILLRAIAQRIENHEQSLIFINRRGYAPALICTSCGWVSSCKQCAGKMVLHLKDQRLRCHHCGYQLRAPHVCPSCSQPALHPVGSGTQRVESVLRERFPDARILRVDKDSTRSKHMWRKMREQIHSNEVDILVGTQMLAKGHDFPALTLVGVLNPDSALYSSDFRAPERLFAQLMQVAGRAGRATKPGEVLIQTSFPDHPLFVALRAHDFEGWAASQLAERKLAGFPPFVYQTMLRAEGKCEADVYAYLNRARAAAIALREPVEILGVVPAALPRRANHVRAQLLIQANTRKAMQQFLHAWQPLLDGCYQQKLRCVLDVDPLEF